jgi:hypothetical protein
MLQHLVAAHLRLSATAQHISRWESGGCRGSIASVSREAPLDDAAILRKYGFEPDPVIEAYKLHVDRTLLRQNLMRTPEERWSNLRRASRLAREMRRAGAEKNGRS